MKLKVITIIQARMGSSRLPGKVMMQLEDKTVLAHVISRLQQAHGIDGIVIATSTLPKDDVIEQEAHRARVFCYRGSETNVLDRYYQAAILHQADIIIRITSDCPLLDPNLVSAMLKKMLALNATGTKVDYMSNCIHRSYPRGLDVEIFTMDALSKAHQAATQEHEREHVTPYIYQQRNLFSLYNYPNDKDLSHYRWTLDTSEDLNLISTIYQELYRHNANFDTQAILDLLAKKPWLADINSNVEQKPMIAS